MSTHDENDTVSEAVADGDGRVGAGASEPRISIRLFSVVVLAALVVASGQALSRTGVRPAADASAPPVASGAWFCPHGGGDGWKGWLIVANPGGGTVRVRETTFGSNASPVARTFTVAPGSEVYREIGANDPASSTEVEYFGGWVAAATVVQSSGSGADVAAERCIAGLGTGWLIPDVTTAADEQASIVVVNPYDAVAEFDVVIRTNKRSGSGAVAPGELSPVVLAPHRSVSIALATWALEGPGEDTVTAQVVPKVGRVIAGSLVTSPRGVRAEPGISAQAGRWLIPSAGYGSSASLVVMNLAQTRAVLTGIAEGPTAPALLPSVTGKDLEPGTVQTFDVAQVANSGFDIRTSNGGTIAVALRIDGPKGGEATMTGVPGAGPRWVVLPTLPASGGTERLILQNPGSSPATVSVALLGPDGPVDASRLASITIPPQTTVSVFLPASDVPLTAVVTAKTGDVVAGSSSQSVTGAAFAATVAVRMP